MKSLIKYFNCGRVETQKNVAVVFKVTKFYDLNQIIIPFFSKYPILGENLKILQIFVKSQIL